MSGRLESPDIALSDVSVGYGERTVLSGVTTVLPGGKVSVILGGSGCGKSTLLRNIIGLVPIQGGRIVLGGHDMAGISEAERLDVRRRMGVLFQDGALLGSLRLGENIALPLREHTELTDSLIEEIVRLKLRLVGLADFMDYFPSELSGGMRKRAGLARAMALDPAVLLCDEPTSGLDPITAADMDQLILELRATFDMTIVVVTHDLESLYAIADHVVVLSAGRMLFEGPLKQLAASDDPFIHQFLARQPSRESRILGESWSAMVESRRISATGGA
ncbi:MAG: ABC-type transport system involved in organic solvent resistance, ATPase component [Solidesulfovibrio magneticus str. Maddingley MBC34]|uniref:ABC-type transport system involved in organic solvent resistance, ATPase component n=1 Tax=Solidesulfovibrio magneticus str. Maddingley MBC34 TaxID=1206767 RepID=K6GRL3_9BACT|nr:MAG: ABC-type transport system involved in organic solvent resistance, ATPase component [Solidesulfovibrio magneticus str. Maddingley MBC34]